MVYGGAHRQVLCVFFIEASGQVTRIFMRLAAQVRTDKCPTRTHIAADAKTKRA